jgi:hypothetical protein
VVGVGLAVLQIHAAALGHDPAGRVEERLHAVPHAEPVLVARAVRRERERQEHPACLDGVLRGDELRGEVGQIALLLEADGERRDGDDRERDGDPAERRRRRAARPDPDRERHEREPGEAVGDVRPAATTSGTAK